MSRLKQLIQEYCPDGVEYRKLGDVATIERGNGLQKKDFVEDNPDCPCIHYGQIYTYYSLHGIATNHAITDVTTSVYEKNIKAKPGDIVMAVTSENVEDVCKCVVWQGDKDIAVSGHTAIIRSDILDPKFLAYYFYSSLFYTQKLKLVHGIKVIEVTPVKMNEIEIPIPPLPVQYEIVRILDAYSKVEQELEKQLNQEQELRKKQYKYYKNNLLAFSDNVQCLSIDALCDVSAGGDAPKNTIRNGKTTECQVPVISNGIGDNALYGYTDKAKITVPAVTVAARGTIGYAEYRNYDYYPVVRLLSVIPKDSEILSTKFLYYCLEDREYPVPTSGIPQLTAPMLKKVIIQVPSIDIQNKIIGILDSFKLYSTDLTSGLPAEISLRKKQYEYYRDRVLSFPRKA